MLHKEFALSPDILTGVEGEKVAVYLLNNREIMNDSHKADGRLAHLLKMSHGVKSVAVAIDSIVDYDLQSFKLKLKESFSL